MYQEHRRNLTPFYRSQLALKLKDTIAAKAKERQRASGGDRKSEGAKSVVSNSSQPIEPTRTRQELAEASSVSENTVSKVEYLTEHADEETKNKLRKGEKGTSIHKEYNRLKAEAVEAKAKERHGKKSDLAMGNIPQLVAECKEPRQCLAEIAKMSHTTLEKAEYINEHADGKQISEISEMKNFFRQIS